MASFFRRDQEWYRRLMPLSAFVVHLLPRGAAGWYSSAAVVPFVAAAPSGPEPPAMPVSADNDQYAVTLMTRSGDRLGSCSSV